MDELSSIQPDFYFPANLDSAGFHLGPITPDRIVSHFSLFQ